MKYVLLAALFLSGCDGECKQSLFLFCASEPDACRTYAQRVAELDALPACTTEESGPLYPILAGSCGARRAIEPGWFLNGRETQFRDDGSVLGVYTFSDIVGDNGCFAVKYGEYAPCELVVDAVWCVSMLSRCGQRAASAEDCMSQ
jgi:hypothetical protein